MLMLQHLLLLSKMEPGLNLQKEKKWVQRLIGPNDRQFASTPMCHLYKIVVIPITRPKNIAYAYKRKCMEQCTGQYRIGIHIQYLQLAQSLTISMQHHQQLFHLHYQELGEEVLL